MAMKSRRIALTHSSLQSRVHSSRLSMLAWTQALTLGLLAASGSGRSLAAEPVSPTAVAVEVADNNQVEEIMITGTRITTGGYGSPNPVMAVGAERIQDMAVTDVAEALNK